MNGFSLFIILTLLGQVGAPLGSALQQEDGAQDSRKSFGWQINALNELEFLVQISPSILPYMQATVDRKERECVIPPELVGRVRRVVVVIGDEVLPRAPLSEVEKLIPIATHSLPGKVLDLEGGSVVNVNNAQGGFPSASGGFSGSHTATNANGFGAGAPAPLGQSTNPSFNTSIGSSASGLAARNNSGAGTTYPAQSGQAGSLYDSIANNGGISGNRFNDTAQPTGGNRNTTQSNFPNQPSVSNSFNTLQANRNLSSPNYDRTADARSGYTGNSSTGPVPDLRTWDNNPPNSGWNRSNGNVVSEGYAPSFSPAFNDQDRFGQLNNNYSSNNNFDRNDPRSQQGNAAWQDSFNRNNSYPSMANRGQVATGFGDSYSNLGDAAQQRRAEGMYDDRYPLRSRASEYLASTGLPTTQPNQNNSPNLSQSPTTSLGHTYPNGQQPLPSSHISHTNQYQDTSYFFYVFFILSIAVNLWLVHLLRTLYLRYRNLLSSLRSQATSMS